jgi:uncharacterized protein (TIGR03437 family)
MNALHLTDLSMIGFFRMFFQDWRTIILFGVIVPLCALAQSPKPTIAAIANVASYANGPVSPGEMVVIFGTGIGPTKLVSLQLDPQGRVATVLSGVQVLFDGIAAPLIYVSQAQTAVMVPYGASGKVTQVQVVYAGASSDTFPKSVSATAPGIFSADASGKGQAAINNSDGSVNSSTNPASPGTYVTFYLTGEGQTDPPGSDGNIAAGTSNVVLPVSVRIAGHLAQFLYSGSAPGNVNGFAQINVVIPADLPYGGNLPILVQIGSVSSQAELTIAVGGPPALIPSAPLNLRAGINASNQIALTWTAADTLALRFHIERSVGSGLFTEVAVMQSPAATFADPSITAGVQYSYRVRAENDYGFSGYSQSASTTITVAQLIPPSSVQAVAVSQTQVNLTWNTANTNATSFQIERKTGTAATYTALVTVPSTPTTYQDGSVVANTGYVYRMRSQGVSGFSAYSGEATVSTPAVPLPSAPVVQATAISSSQIHLAWVSNATSIVRFRIERRLATTQYAEINQPSPSATSFDDSSLGASTSYFYRIRIENGGGVSPYSNEVTATTLQGLPTAPANLQATAISSTQLTLTWANIAPDATSIRVEYLPSGSSTFTDIFAAVTLTSTGVSNLQPNTTYSFRVRAQNAAGYSPYSNVATVTTLPPPITVVLVHGINQSGGVMEPLAITLRSILQPSQRYTVDAGFDWGRCANLPLLTFCPTDCSIEEAADELRNYINQKVPPGDIVLVGYSMGGLIARQLLMTTQFTRNRPLALVTLGTPNLGYPYSFFDTVLVCGTLGTEMSGDFRANNGKGDFSSYLLNLNNTWSNSVTAPATGRWLAVSGTSCNVPARLNGSGCPDNDVFSDGVVCDVSARLLFQYKNRPSEDFFSANFFHTAGHGLMCDNTASLPALYNPGAYSDVGQRLARFINGL